MRFAAGEGKHMFNKRLTAAQAPGNPIADKKRAADKAALRSLTGRRQTKWLQPLGKNPDHWMHIVNACKA
ncbi:hypothetical protein BQ8482_350015 [Mesorhizobium delmotii]|uniref:Uncharacterized protein n=1 Tax=Mesorhizobium delmotii TaxID=1631247 RepID=A0A2P9AQD0_9HYPH|nr:hypothetical protein BQ8482_350015 [Mesorhizobium delmotii]